MQFHWTERLPEMAIVIFEMIWLSLLRTHTSGMIMTKSCKMVLLLTSWDWCAELKGSLYQLSVHPHIGFCCFCEEINTLAWSFLRLKLFLFKGPAKGQFSISYNTQRKNKCWSKMPNCILCVLSLLYMTEALYNFPIYILLAWDLFYWLPPPGYLTLARFRRRHCTSWHISIILYTRIGNELLHCGILC